MPTSSETMRSLPGRFRPKEAGNLRATVQFRLLGDDGGEWFMSIDSGSCEVTPGESNEADATVVMDAADFVGINTGTVSAVDTFWGGRIIVEGDIDVVLALPPVMDWR
jgi:putative sterol carrier protein